MSGPSAARDRACKLVPSAARFLVIFSIIYEGFIIPGSTTGINRIYQNRVRYKRFSESVTAREIKTRGQPCSI